MLRRSLILLLVLLTGGLAIAAADGGTTIERRVFEIARQLRCPICVSESVAASSAQVSITMREQIQEQLEAGRTEQQILDSFSESYGDWILLEPPRSGVHLLVWLLPAVVAVAGAILLVGFIRRSTRAGNEPVSADAADIERVRQELEDRENEK